MRHYGMFGPKEEPEENDIEEPPKLRDLTELIEGPVFHRYNQMFVMITDNESRYLEEGDIVRIGIHYYELLEPGKFPDLGRCYLVRPFHPYLTDTDLREVLGESA
jgi:hypothetical protein